MGPEDTDIGRSGARVRTFVIPAREDLEIARGVREVLAPNRYPAPEAGARALAAELQDLMANGTLRRARGIAGRSHIERRHLIGQAAETLLSGIAAVTGAAA